jgi:hypothetical protein
MNFREATDGLFDRVDHEDLAKALGVSIASIRQARLPEVAKAKRSPPSGWEDAVLKLLEQRLARYTDLLRQLRAKERPRPSKNAVALENRRGRSKRDGRLHHSTY